MRRGIATVSLSGTLDEKLRAAAAAGFDGVELFENDVIASPLAPEEIRRLADELGLALDMYQPLRDFEAVPADAFARNLRRAEHKLDLMERLGTTTMLLCASVAPEAIDDDALAAEHLHRLAEKAGERGMRIAYEALAWSRHVNDYRHAWLIVRAADHPALGVCLDSFHILSRDDDPRGIREIPADRLFFLQLADAPHLIMDVLQWSRHYRCFPGQGGFDLAAFLEHALAAGYAGPLSLEIFNDVFRQADPFRTAVDAMRSLVVLEEATRQRLADAPAALAAPPAPVPSSGYAFVELATDDQSTAATEAALGRLGFVRTGRHRSKPVELWQQGTARVLVNRGDERLGEELRGDAAITAIAVETADPLQAAQRADALLAHPLPREHGPAEADLTAVAAPDGTSVFFCRTGAGERDSWLGDFVADGDDAGAVALERIDHVALSHPFDHFDEAVLFFRSLLGLRPRPSLEVPAPYGLVKSRALQDLAGSLRTVLNVSVLSPTGAVPRTGEPQHIAYACDDALGAARAMRARGLALLAIPDNYYDDVAARYELDDAFLEALRTLDVLYDRDERGEFLHFFTEPVGSRLLFEVVQRRGGYAGYGAANAPVRMAAYRAALRRVQAAGAA